MARYSLCACLCACHLESCLGSRPLCPYWRIVNYKTVTQRNQDMLHINISDGLPTVSLHRHAPFAVMVDRQRFAWACCFLFRCFLSCHFHRRATRVFRYQTQCHCRYIFYILYMIREPHSKVDYNWARRL